MIEIDNTILSKDVFTEAFVCDLGACKGACCIEGDAGAPLEDDELEKLEEVFKTVKTYMRPEGISAVRKQGKFVIDTDGEPVTPLVQGRECAYVYFDDNQVASCAIERAYLDGKIDFRKPISCHLYPIRIQKYAKFDAINYERNPICRAACKCGTKLKVKVYAFLKNALIRKYGEGWYEKLELAGKMLEGEGTRK